MGMYRHKMPDRELSEEMTKADYWEVQADMWHQNYKEATDEIVKLREALLDAVGFVSRADRLFLRKSTTDTLKGIPDGYC